jgi:hypothetical protein
MSGIAGNLNRTKWATFAFWNFINPVLKQHHMFYRRKVAVDRYFESQGFLITSGIGVLFGGAVYFVLVPILPGNGAPYGETLEMNANGVLKDLGLEASKEFPIFTLLRAKSEIMNRIHIAMDRVDVRKAKDEVARLKREVEALKQQQSMSAVSSDTSPTAARKQLENAAVGQYSR